MSPVRAVALLHHFLFAVLVQSAPISWSNTPPAFKEAASRAETLVEKILRDIPAAHAAAINIQGLSLDGSTQTSTLQTMVTSLGIPAAPVLRPPSERFTLDVCVSRMSAGSQLYQGLLGVLSDKLSSLSDLQADLRDLLTHINKMTEAAELGGGGGGGGVEDQSGSDLASRLTAPSGSQDYEVQVAAHLTLTQLRSFCRDLSRSLGAIATYRPPAAQ